MLQASEAAQVIQGNDCQPRTKGYASVRSDLSLSKNSAGEVRLKNMK